MADRTREPDVGAGLSLATRAAMTAPCPSAGNFRPRDEHSRAVAGRPLAYRLRFLELRRFGLLADGLRDKTP